MASSSNARAKRARPTIQYRDEDSESEHEESEFLAAPAQAAPAQAARRPRSTRPSNPPPERPLSTHVSFFANQAALDDFLVKVGEREVLKERKFSASFLRENNWPYLDDLITWGWWDIMNWNNRVMVDLVRNFYYNGDRREYVDGVPDYNSTYLDAFITSVLGNRFEVDRNLIAQFLPNPLSNVCDETYDLDLIQATRLVYNNDNLDSFHDDVIPLGFNNRILHLLLCCTIEPRRGTHAVVSKGEMEIMARIILKKPPSLCEVIAMRMAKAVSSARSTKSKAALPFGRLVTQICTHHCQNLGQEIYGGSEMSLVDAKAVKAMGWKKRNGVYVWVGPKQNKRAGIVIGEPQEQAQEPVVGAMDMNALATQIQQMHWQQMEQAYLQREEQRQWQEASTKWQQETTQWMEEQNQWRDVSNQRDIYFDAQLRDIRMLQNLPPSTDYFPVYPPPPPPPEQ